MEYVSASQIKQYISCPRAWAFAYLEGKKGPETKALAFGKRLHRELELFLTEDRYPTMPLAQEVIKSGLIPEPFITLDGADYFVEVPTIPYELPPDMYQGEISKLYIGGLPVKGFVDLVIPPRSAFGPPEIIDYKTTSDWKWAKSSEALARDVQMQIYALWYLAVYPEPCVRVSHIVCNKSTGTVRKTSATLTRADLGPVKEELDQIVREMRKRATPANGVPSNTSACYKYGGCPHRSYCVLKPKKKEKKKMGKVDLSAILGRRVRNKAPETPAPEKAPPVPPDELPTGIVPPDAEPNEEPVPLDQRNLERVMKTRFANILKEQWGCVTVGDLGAYITKHNTFGQGPTVLLKTLPGVGAKSAQSILDSIATERVMAQTLGPEPPTAPEPEQRTWEDLYLETVGDLSVRQGRVDELEKKLAWFEAELHRRTEQNEKLTQELEELEEELSGLLGASAPFKSRLGQERLVADLKALLVEGKLDFLIQALETPS